MKSRLVSLFVGLLMAAVAVFGTVVAPEGAQAASVKRVTFASAGFHESNRAWTVSRPDHLQFEPFWETLIGTRSQDLRSRPGAGDEVGAQPGLQGVDLPPAQGRAVPLRLRRVHVRGRRALARAGGAQGFDVDAAPVLGNGRGSEARRQAHGGVPLQESGPALVHGFRRLALRRPADGEQGAVGQGGSRRGRQTAGRDRPLHVPGAADRPQHRVPAK